MTVSYGVGKLVRDPRYSPMQGDVVTGPRGGVREVMAASHFEHLDDGNVVFRMKNGRHTFVSLREWRRWGEKARYEWEDASDKGSDR